MTEESAGRAYLKKRVAKLQALLAKETGSKDYLVKNRAVKELVNLRQRLERALANGGSETIHLTVDLDP